MPTTMNNLLILDQNAKEYERKLKKLALPNLKLISSISTSCSINHIQKANIILGQPNLVAQILEHANQLEWMQSTFAGVEDLCKQDKKTDYTLTGVKEIFGPLISEYVFAYILAIERNIFQTQVNQQDSSWISLSYRSLAGIRIGIFGLGSIGKHVAKTASYFRMKVTGLKRSSGEVEYVDQVFDLSKLDRFVEELDYLIITLPDTPDTKHIIDKSILSQMKKSAVIINVGRGSVIVEDDLAAALQNDRLRATVLDVFDHEPLSIDSPLWKMKNTIVTPHNAALSFPEDIIKIFIDNYMNFINNRPLKYIVNFKLGY